MPFDTSAGFTCHIGRHMIGKSHFLLRSLQLTKKRRLLRNVRFLGVQCHKRRGSSTTAIVLQFCLLCLLRGFVVGERCVAAEIPGRYDDTRKRSCMAAGTFLVSTFQSHCPSSVFMALPHAYFSAGAKPRNWPIWQASRLSSLYHSICTLVCFMRQFPALSHRVKCLWTEFTAERDETSIE